MEAVFWISCCLVGYAYAGYPVVLMLLGGLFRRDLKTGPDYSPMVSIIVPVYNEGKVIREKLENLLALEKPEGGLEILVVSDCSSDESESEVARFLVDGVRWFALGERSGKGAALNLGVSQARGELIVFTDASILLEPDSLVRLLEPLGDETVGCVSGEDHIRGGGGEGAYGRYELYLRNQESRIGSIVGASGCFYAQRRALVVPFLPGMAPDFLSVLVTVKEGYRAVTEPAAVGWMKAVPARRGEFPRKVRTLLRGMTTLFHFRQLLNPFRHGLFTLELWSHKVLRWLAGAFMVLALASNAALAGNPLYNGLLAIQVLFYVLAVIGWKGPRRLADFSLVRLPFFFCLVNGAALVALGKWASGERLEIWEPSKR
ncbi:MAG: glycosyltransferase [Acidobacteria bacterium]|uniref:Glycosyltransferase n=1 Tax=Candidatus Polarisedimenticola svalbardensis TaxID=2886004 RepID=A0A8J6Y603_9BACT|nr:glycosyltransferase [Candidatus Polarisedimenticola svalbardensis]